MSLVQLKMALSELQIKLNEAEKRAAEAEASGQKAARYGQQLLDKLKTSESRMEDLIQEKHELNLKYQAKLTSQANYEDEFDSLRKQIQDLKHKCSQSKKERDSSSCSRLFPAKSQPVENLFHEPKLA